MPPEFCWRGNNPACPSHHPRRSGLLCYRDCEEVHQEDIAIAEAKKNFKKANQMKRYHYKLWGGVCWEQCDQYEDERREKYKSFLLVTCKSKKHWYHWHFKRSFVTSSVTNYNSGAICPEDSKKSWFLGLCYRKCEDFGFVSCGFGACARDPAMCKKHIFLIVGKTILGVAETVLFGLTLGASGAVKEALHLIKSVEEGVASKFVEKLIFDAADLAPKLLEKYKTMSEIYKNEKLKANILIDCKTKTKILLAGYPLITEEMITEECEHEIEISEQGANFKSNYLTENIIKFTNAKTAKQKLAVIGEASLKVLDFVLLNGIIDTIKTCRKMDPRIASDNEIVECIKGGLAFAADLDPTGIVGLINTFVYPTCRADLDLIEK